MTGVESTFPVPIILVKLKSSNQTTFPELEFTIKFNDEEPHAVSF